MFDFSNLFCCTAAQGRNMGERNQNQMQRGFLGCGCFPNQGNQRGQNRISGIVGPRGPRGYTGPPGAPGTLQGYVAILSSSDEATDAANTVVAVNGLLPITVKTADTSGLTAINGGNTFSFTSTGIYFVTFSVQQNVESTTESQTITLSLTDGSGNYYATETFAGTNKAVPIVGYGIINVTDTTSLYRLVNNSEAEIDLAPLIVSAKTIRPSVQLAIVKLS